VTRTNPMGWHNIADIAHINCLPMTKNFHYDLDARRIDHNTWLLFEEISVSRQGKVTGRKVKRMKTTGQYYFQYKRKLYFVGKVVLCLFKPETTAHKDFHHLDNKKKNNHVNNLAWGIGMAVNNLPPSLAHKGETYLYCASAPGFYVSENGKIMSLRDPRKGTHLIKQRLLEGIPCVGYHREQDAPGATRYTHLLVLEAWANYPYGSTKCIWRDGKRTNSRLENLRPTNYGEMMLNHFREGRRKPNTFRDILDKTYGKNIRPWLNNKPFEQ